MKKRKIAFLVLFLFLSFSTVSQADVKRAIVIFDSYSKQGVIPLVNLIGHFREYRAEYLDVSEFDPASVKKEDAIFFLGSYNSPVPEKKLLTFLNSRKGITCFMGNSKWQCLPEEELIDSVSYRGKVYFEDPFYTKKLKKNMGRTVVNYKSGGKSVPFIQYQNKKWYVRGSPFFETRGLIFADILHDVLEVSHSKAKSAMIRLEDINPSYKGKDLDKLKEAVYYLVNEGIPFSLAVYPVFMTANGEKTADILPYNEGLVQILQYSEKHGGTIIMHGTSHQYYQVSGEGSEFWDMETDDHIPNEKSHMDRRIRYGLWLFKQSGLHPQLFEAPHYNLPPTLQVHLLHYFKTLAGSVMINNDTYETTQDLPYLIYRSWAGLRILPEQLGYIAMDNKYISLKTIEDKLTILTEIVRDPFACFFYHPYVAGDSYLRKIIPVFRSMGYSFVDAGSFGSGPLVPVEEVSPIWRVKKSKTYTRQWGTVIAVMIIPVVLLIWGYLKVQGRRKRRLF